MQFHHPEILYFLFLLLIPILVHLFELRRYQKQRFSNVQFLRELAQQTRKSAKLKKYLLLASRLLLLAFAVLAFAQPFIPAKDSQNAANPLYVVLDNSMSMQANGANGPLLKRAVQELLEALPADRPFSLLTNNERFLETDLASVRQELQQLHYSPMGFDLNAQLASVDQLSPGSTKDVLVLTDAVGIPAEDLQKATHARFVIFERQQQQNAAIDSVYLNQTLDNFYEIAVVLSRQGTEEMQVPVAVYNQNTLIAKTMVSLAAEQKTQLFTIPKTAFEGRVEISDNALAFDNQYFFVLSEPVKTRVISIGPEEKSGFLKRIYTDDDFAFENHTLDKLDYNALEHFQVVVLNEPDQIPEALTTTLTSLLEKGLRLVFIPSDRGEVTSYHYFLNKAAKTQLQSIDPTDKRIAKIEFSHPLFSGVFEKQVQNFDYPKVKTSWMLAGGNPALRFEDQSAFVASFGVESGLLYVFSAPLHPAAGNFQNSPLIVPTFDKMAQGGDSDVKSLVIGRGASLTFSELLNKDEVLSVKGEGTTFIPMQKRTSHRIALSFDHLPEKQGIYGIYRAETALAKTGFNYDRNEGRAPVAEAALKTLSTESNIADALEKWSGNRNETPLWKWFVALALLFVICEILIQRLLK